jgi:hypothetical protein
MVSVAMAVSHVLAFELASQSCPSWPSLIDGFSAACAVPVLPNGTATMMFDFRTAACRLTTLKRMVAHSSDESIG